MASESFGLLLQAVQECVVALNDQVANCRKLASQCPALAEWLNQTAAELEKLSNGLHRWQRKVKDKHNKHDEVTFRNEVRENSTRCGFLRHFLDKILSQVETLTSETEPTPETTSTAQDIVSRDLSAMAKLVENIKWLDTFFTVRPANPLAQRHAIVNITLRDLFALSLDKIPRDNRSFSVFHRGCVDFEKMDFFWNNVLRPEGMTNTSHSGGIFDGELIRMAHVLKAKNALEQFKKAWLDVEDERLEVENCEDYTKDSQSLQNFVSMPIIACVLQAYNRKDLFNDFMHREITDSALDEAPAIFLERVRRAVGDKADPSAVVAQFSRARQRPWESKVRLELELNEPLPLIHQNRLNGEFSAGGLASEVFKVKDAWDPSQRYLLKAYKPNNNKPEHRTRLLNEIALLEELQQQHTQSFHFIRCEKSYIRGPAQQQEIGMLMVPAANGDLDSILSLCQTSTRLRERYRHYLIQACGCLSYSLAYFHNIARLGHFNIKPHNIFYKISELPDQVEFLWTGFENSTFLDRQNLDTTPNQDLHPPPHYRAPELNLPSSNSYTEAVDIFALGCVFLEIAYVLSLQKENPNPLLEPRRLYWRNDEFYAEHTKGLLDLIKDLSKSISRKDRELHIILDLAQHMICDEPKRRSKIGDVVKQLWHANPSELFCLTCHENLKHDLGSNPKHPGILGAESESRMSLSTILSYRHVK